MIAAPEIRHEYFCAYVPEAVSGATALSKTQVASSADFLEGSERSTVRHLLGAVHKKNRLRRNQERDLINLGVGALGRLVAEWRIPPMIRGAKSCVIRHQKYFLEVPETTCAAA